jgi:hypothetical protein
MCGICMRLFCVYVGALRRADHSSKESYHLWKMITELNKRPGPWMGWKSHWKKEVIFWTGLETFGHSAKILESVVFCEWLFALNVYFHMKRNEGVPIVTSLIWLQSFLTCICYQRWKLPFCRHDVWHLWIALEVAICQPGKLVTYDEW